VSNEDLESAFDAMTPEEHEEMKSHLLELAKAGDNKPADDTFEGYCLDRYTSKAARAD
jgi:hypothetical protein